MPKEVKHVGCCATSHGFLEERPNDQTTSPGYRNVRLRILALGEPAGDIHIRFCPWCGTEFQEGTRAPETEPVCTCKTQSGNHEYSCPVSLKSRGKSWQPLNTADWELEEERMKTEMETLRQKLSDHKFRCTHKNADGIDIRQAVGGGETFCYTCRQQFD